MLVLNETSELTYGKIDKSRYLDQDVVNYRYELRQYGNFLTASIRNTKRNAGFHILEDYIGISGVIHNKDQKILNFQNPYLSNQFELGNFDLSFVLPSFLDEISDAPEPEDQRVNINKHSKSVWAVKTFTWNYSYRRGQKFLHQLFKELQDNKLIAQNVQLDSLQALVAHYSSQFNIPFLKRHEVWIKIEQKYLNQQIKQRITL